MKVKITQTVNLESEERKAIAFALDDGLTGRKATHAECASYIRSFGSDFSNILREYYLAESEEYADRAAEYFDAGRT